MTSPKLRAVPGAFALTAQRRLHGSVFPARSNFLHRERIRRILAIGIHDSINR